MNGDIHASIRDYLEGGSDYDLRNAFIEGVEDPIALARAHQEYLNCRDRLMDVRGRQPVEQRNTPGPWNWQFSGTAGCWVLRGHNGESVHLGGPPSDDLTPDQRLIAAAPDLYRALTLLVDEIGDDMRYERKEVCDTVAAALAKAVGQ